MNKKLTEFGNDYEWIVFSIGGSAPTVSHDTEESAKTEACRLSGLHPTKQFFVARIKWKVTSVLLPKTETVKIYE